MAKSRRRYSPEFKFQVVMEVLQSDKSLAEIARAYDVHPVTLRSARVIEGHMALPKAA